MGTLIPLTAAPPTHHPRRSSKTITAQPSVEFHLMIRLIRTVVLVRGRIISWFVVAECTICCGRRRTWSFLRRARRHGYSLPQKKRCHVPLPGTNVWWHQQHPDTTSNSPSLFPLFPPLFFFLCLLCLSYIEKKKKKYKYGGTKSWNIAQHGRV